MRFWTAFAALALAIMGQAAFAGVCYEEQFAAHFAEYDFVWQPTGILPAFLVPIT